jgi:hypothetical protein
MKHVLAICLAAAATAGCASGGKPATAHAEPAFELTGSRIIGCCCAAPCPCRLNKKPMQCHGCDHTDAVHIDRGHIGKTSMDGVSWVVIGRGFGEKPEANWVVIYLDEKATPDQEKALMEMMGADIKSWGEKAKHLAGDFKGVKRVPMTYTISADRKEWSALIPGILDLRTRAVYNPNHDKPVVSTGIMDAFGDRFVHADPIAHKYHDAALKYEWDLTGRQANQAEFHMTPESVAKRGGWGCWTAHAAYNDSSKYQEQLIEHK